MNRIAAALAMGSVLLVGSACGGSGNSAPPQPRAPAGTITVTVTPPAQTITTTVHSTPPASGASSTHKVGATVAIATAKISFKVSALRVQTAVHQGNPYEKPDSGQQYDGVLVKFCLQRNDFKRDISVSSLPWSLRFASGAVADETTFLSETPSIEPAYPDDAPVPVGTCAKGWLVFQGPAGERPSLIVYASSSTARAVTWTVPK